MIPGQEEKLLEVSVVGRKINADASTVRRMFHQGILKGIRTGPSGTRIRIFESSVKDHLNKKEAVC